MSDSGDHDELMVARALREDQEALCARAPIPPAGFVWWRATIRARADAARTVERPMAVAQFLAVACLLALAVSAVASTWRMVPEAVAQHAVLVVVGVAVCLLVAPVALLAALSD
jgi:hypothetical protein